MALKKIRIMEPYGFQDQNDFDPTNCRCEDDIKDIKKVNDAQTDEINSILSGKADASLVEELSAITDAYLIELEKLEDKDKELEQLINDEEEARKLADAELWDAISGSSLNCEATKEELLTLLDIERNARECGDNELEEKLNEQSEKIDSLSGMVESEVAAREAADDEINGKLEELAQKVDEGLADLNDKFDTEKEERVAADKELKDNIDDLSGVVKSNTEAIAALNEAVNGDISGLTSSVAELGEKLNDLSDKLDEVKDTADKAFDATEVLSGAVQQAQESADKANGDLAKLDEKVEQVKATADNTYDAVTTLSGKVAKLINKTKEQDGAIKQNADDILTLRRDVEAADRLIVDKIDAAIVDHDKDIAELRASDDAINASLNTKAEQADLNDTNQSLAVLSGTVEANKTEFDTFKSETNSHLNTLDSSVEKNKTDIESLSASTDERINKEIADREAGDKALLGDEETATAFDPTIYGLKELINVTSGKTLNEAVESAKAYTDTEIDYAIGVAEDKDKALFEKVENKLKDEYLTLSGAAETYITKTKSKEDDDKVLSDANKKALEYYNEAVSGYTEADEELEELIKKNTNSIHHITEFDFNDPNNDEYVHSGNGVLDVLHREFHKFVEDNRIGVELFESSEEEGIRAQVLDKTEGGNNTPMIQIHDDGTLWIMIEGSMHCLNEILAGLVGETY